MKHFFLSAISAAVLLACQGADMPSAAFKSAALANVLKQQPAETKARFAARRPAQTLEFFGIVPGMTVVEALPGGGWYTKILLPYLGPEGALIGAHYPDGMWQNIRTDEDWIAARVEDTRLWPERAAAWDIENAATVHSFSFSEMPAQFEGTADAALFIRTLHSLNRFEDKNGYFTDALSETYRALKPGGILGVVQHRAPQDSADSWAYGGAGYLKQGYMIKAFEKAGFVFEASSEINANPNDKPKQGDIVWRLPPTFAGSKQGTEARAAVIAIGESDRMTLRFRKPKAPK